MFMLLALRCVNIFYSKRVKEIKTFRCPIKASDISRSVRPRSSIASAFRLHGKLGRVVHDLPFDGNGGKPFRVVTVETSLLDETSLH